jgi:calpain-15
LSTLTGAPAIYVDLEQEGTEPNAPNRAAVLDLIWARLLSAREAGYLMGCSCGAGKREPDEAEVFY